jgi:apolipoprotein N-acyltransferase
MNNIRLQRVLTSVSLVTQAFGFAMLGSLTALRGGSDNGTRIGGLLSVLTGTMFLMAAIAYWRTCHRQTGQRLGVPGIQAVASSAPALAGLERRSIRPTHREKRPRRQIDGVGGALLATATNAFGAVS